ncbi:MAG: anhydro-N-acetylmuramic acid kinase [Rhodobacteraceae bacterium]|nr:anhydro-N-acetylmuramic acid kinase [Paracoccaceae bacterium]
MENTEPQWAIGCMSGTSMDGVDAAALLTDGKHILSFGQTEFRPYSEAERVLLRRALGHWPGSDEVRRAEEIVTRAHIDILQRFDRVSLIGFHGQTVAHDPENARTHQIGSAGAVADALDTPVIWDFRTEDMRLQGQGAPLAPFFHFALAKRLNLTEPVQFVNLGGVGNLTWVNPNCVHPVEPGALIAFDTGPANAPIDDLLLSRLALPFDRNGTVARSGQISEDLLSAFLRHHYFSLSPPKSLDRNDFSDLFKRVGELRTADAAATLTACAAHSVAEALAHLPAPPTLTLLCGGGRRNPELVRMLRNLLPMRITDIDRMGCDGDMLEAQAFAHLAVRSLHRLPLSSPTTTGCRQPSRGGRLCLPAH